MSYLRPELSGEFPLWSEWVEYATATGGTATATRVLSSGKSHYVGGVAGACQAQTSQEPDEMTCELQDGTSGIWKVSFQSVAVNDNTPGGDATKLLTFTHPIKITSGNQVRLLVAGATGYAAAYSNIWGFTR